eukprot:gnl/Hemi2/18432_TR6101_c0_g1_i1.p1 gnl/Hemi2/18432_TR6101_c0_g1~~gnl/Hemi2/18432_TR6101_c0_g1_i1.p1  ORF type:complete len:322 (-),score=89.28 gnl/Hemi2/18432_TR6101_c0_g1_i1:265-1230(-)
MDPDRNELVRNWLRGTVESPAEIEQAQALARALQASFLHTQPSFREHKDDLPPPPLEKKNPLEATGVSKPTTEPKAKQADSFFKVVLLGDSGVGKTAFITRAVHDKFVTTHTPSQGLALSYLQTTVEENVVGFEFWDIGGSAATNKMIGNCIHGAHIILFFYDMTNYQAFIALRTWHALAMCFADTTCQPWMALVATKADQPRNRTVQRQRHLHIAKTLDLHPFEISSQAELAQGKLEKDSNINTLLMHMTRAMISSSWEDKGLIQQSRRSKLAHMTLFNAFEEDDVERATKAQPPNQGSIFSRFLAKIRGLAGGGGKPGT